MNAKTIHGKITPEWLAALDDDEWEQLLPTYDELPAETQLLVGREMKRRLRKGIEECIERDKEAHASCPDTYQRKLPDTFAEWWEQNKERYPWLASIPDPNIDDDEDVVGKSEPSERV